MKSRHAIAEIDRIIDGIIDSLTASMEGKSLDKNEYSKYNEYKEAAVKLQEVKGIINKLEE